MLVGVVLLGSAALSERSGLELAATSSVVVASGDTLWSIAAGLAEDGDDVRDVVDAIRRLNELDGVGVVPGQVLDLP